VGALLRTVVRTGFRRGLGGGPGGKGWLALGVAAGVLQFLRRKTGQPKVQITEDLKPGQTLVIRHLAKGEARFR
jgi:hypothetical protein